MKTTALGCVSHLVQPTGTYGQGAVEVRILCGDVSKSGMTTTLPDQPQPPAPVCEAAPLIVDTSPPAHTSTTYHIAAKLPYFCPLEVFPGSDLL